MPTISHRQAKQQLSDGQHIAPPHSHLRCRRVSTKWPCSLPRQGSGTAFHTPSYHPTLPAQECDQQRHSPEGPWILHRRHPMLHTQRGRLVSFPVISGQKSHGLDEQLSVLGSHALMKAFLYSFNPHSVMNKPELDHDTSTQSLGKCTTRLLPPESVQAPFSQKAALQTAQLQAY